MAEAIRVGLNVLIVVEWATRSTGAGLKTTRQVQGQASAAIQSNAATDAVDHIMSLLSASRIVISMAVRYLQTE